MKKLWLPILAIVVLLAGATIWFATRLPASPFDGQQVTEVSADELVARGEYVARQADCVACHSFPGEVPFSGGLEMGTPLGSIFATNITPNAEHGIGAYTLADFDRAVRHGVAPGGRRLYPAMPYPSYKKMTDGDVEALYAFFTTAVEASDKPNKDSTIEWPLDMRWPLAFWNLVFTDGGTYVAKSEEDEQWNRGAYLVQGAGHCGTCHTPRGLVFNEKGFDESDPQFLSGALLDGWYAPSLRQDHNTGLGRWSEDDIFAFLKDGRNQHAVVFGSMADAYNNSTQFLSEDDLKAMAHYLKSLPGKADGKEAAWTYQPSAILTAAAASQSGKPGAEVYLEKCGFCHGVDGKGQNQWIPPLAGSSASLAEFHQSQVNVTLNGSARVVSNGIPDSYRMPPYRNQLSDQEIADVLTYVRSSWGNDGGAVTVEDVQKLREDTDPASSDPIILQMR
ncbi:cytochrome c [Fulvimarina sp. MAC3]|uniref:c-type cytochrome n=1 Tax=Fulvimarina sp. MAC3 TaxID=3148887 RepID=UPI0031FC41C1